jgi:hypothetical protein
VEAVPLLFSAFLPVSASLVFACYDFGLMLGYRQNFLRNFNWLPFTPSLVASSVLQKECILEVFFKKIIATVLLSFTIITIVLIFVNGAVWLLMSTVPCYMEAYFCTLQTRRAQLENSGMPILTNSFSVLSIWSFKCLHRYKSL